MIQLIWRFFFGTPPRKIKRLHSSAPKKVLHAEVENLRYRINVLCDTINHVIVIDD